MKSIFTFLLFLLCQYISACALEMEPAYMNNDNFEARPYLNISGELYFLGKYFFPEAESMQFIKVHADRNKIVEDEIRKACAGKPEQIINDYISKFHEAHANALKGKYLQFTEDEKDHLLSIFCYEQGLSELHSAAGASSQCPEPWKKLLQNHDSYRSCWILYMLGNMNMTENSKLGHSYYRQLRDAAKKTDGNCQDPLGLAYDSFRNDYAYEQDTVEKLKYALYCYTVYTAGKNQEDAEKVKNDILEIVRKNYRNVSPEKQRSILKDQLAREIVLLVLSMRKFRGFLSDFEREEGTQCIIADRIAIGEYADGNKKACMEYLSLAPDNSIIKLWLSARFARQDKEYAEAARLLRKWLTLYGTRETSPVFFQNWYLNDSMKKDVLCLLGSVLAGDDCYSEALYTFIQAGDRTDAACIAEQLMDNNELITFCRNHCNDPDQAMHLFIRHVLAKKLMRAGRPQEALEFFPDYIKEAAAEPYCAYSQCGNDHTESREKRAIAFMKAAIITKANGDWLFSTELQPDNMILYGDYDYYALKENWYTSYGARIWSKYQKNKSSLPDKRWHYRYRAAETFGRAAAISENPALRVLSYYLAGKTIGHRDPQRADIYYKMLCDCYPHPFAKETAERHWFPEKLNPELQNIYDTLLKELGLYREQKQSDPPYSNEFEILQNRLYENDFAPIIMWTGSIFNPSEIFGIYLE